MISFEINWFKFTKMIQLEQSVSVMESSLYQVGMSDNCSHGFNY